MRRIGYSWAVLSIGFMVLFFGGGSRHALGLMLKPMSDDLEWSRSTLSLAITCFMLVSAFAMPFVGRLADRYELRWIMAAGAAIGGLGIGLMAVISAPWQLFLVYGLVFALGAAGVSNPIVGVMISRWFPGRRGIANSAAVSGNATGQLFIVGLLTEGLVRFGWRAGFAALGVINVLVIVPVVLAVVRSAPPPIPESDLANSPALADDRPPLPEEWQQRLLGSGQLWLLCGVYAICGFQDFFVATHVVAFSLDEGIGPVFAGNLLALMGLMGLVGVLASGLLSDAYGPGRPTMVCFLMRIGIFGLVLLSHATPAVVIFALLYGFTFLMTAPLTVVFSGNIFGPARLGTVSGTISMVHQVAGGLGALAGAVIFDQWNSYQPMFALLLALAVAASAGTYLVKDRHRAV